MKKAIQFDKLSMKTKDLTKENIAKLTSIFPDLITEIEINGEVIKTINADKLKELIGDYATNFNEVYELTWVGKQKSRQKIVTPVEETLRPSKDSLDFENTENLYIEGDNFKVLKLLQESYLNKVNMIYIDPPYNTGKDFVYKDDFTKSLQEYAEESEVIDEEGNKLFKNTATNGRFHSDWLSMMYERLVIAKDLLNDEGIIFISIDDNEVTNLKKICEEVFGEANFISQVIVNRPSEIAGNYTISKHEYLLVFAKDINVCVLKGNEKVTISRGTVGNEDQSMPIIEFPKGLKCYNIKDGTYTKTRQIEGSNENIENLTPIIVKDGVLKEPIKLKAKWRSSNDMRNFFANKCQPTAAKIAGELIEIYFENDKFNPQIRKRTNEKLSSMYLENNRGSKDLEELSMGGTFSFPKSVDFIKYLLNFGNDNDLILDFFSGSSTTAQAVMETNVATLGKRKYIMVQICEDLDNSLKDSQGVQKNAIESAIKFLDSIHKPHLLTEIGKERIKRAIKKIQDEIKEKNKQLKLDNDKIDVSQLDFGFRVFKLDSSNMKDVYYNPTEINQTTLKNFKDNIKDDRTDKDLLYQVLLELAVPISAKVNEEQIHKKTIYRVDDNYLIACFDEEIDLDTIKKITELNPLRIVFKDISFKDDATKVNCSEYLKNKLPNCIVKVI